MPENEPPVRDDGTIDMFIRTTATLWNLSTINNVSLILNTSPNCAKILDSPNNLIFELEYNDFPKESRANKLPVSIKITSVINNFDWCMATFKSTDVANRHINFMLGNIVQLRHAEYHEFNVGDEFVVALAVLNYRGAVETTVDEEGWMVIE